MFGANAFGWIYPAQSYAEATSTGTPDACGRPAEHPDFGQPCTDACGRDWTDANYGDPCPGDMDACGRPDGHPDFGQPCFDACGRYWTDSNFEDPCEGGSDYCGCSVADSSCINARGKGTSTNPITLAPYLDPDSGNIIICTSAGMRLLMQDRFVWPTMRKIRDRVVPLNAGEAAAIPFSTVEYDDYAMSVTLEEARAPFDGKWRIETYVAFDRNNGSYNSIQLELNSGSGYSVVSGSREERDSSVSLNDRSRLSHADEFFMKAGDKVRISIGENASGVVNIQKASLVMTLVSL